jgi:hypothetical protein
MICLEVKNLVSMRVVLGILVVLSLCIIGIGSVSASTDVVGHSVFSDGHSLSKLTDNMPVVAISKSWPGSHHKKVTPTHHGHER